MMIVGYEIEDDEEALSPLFPLIFYLYSNTGYRVKPLHTVKSTGQLSGQFSFDMLQYPTGTYHIVVENDDQILGGKQFVFVK